MEKEVRLPTGIPGFDRLCTGGLISDSINLLTGNPGAGKTTFSLQFLYSGAQKYGESGLFITFENDVEDLKRVTRAIGIDPKFGGSDAQVHFLRYDFKKPIKHFQNKLVSMIAEHDIRRICLDPINVFALEFSDKISIRRQLYDFLSLLKKLNVCIIISGETDDNEEGSGSNSSSEAILFCRYLVDGVIQLYASGLSGSGSRAVRITKMRMTNHTRGPMGMELTDKGVKVLKS